MNTSAFSQPSIKTVLFDAETKLHTHSDSPKLDAEVLLSHLLAKTRTYLYTYPERTLSQSEWQQFQTLISQRATGKPVAYLTGLREFWSLPLKVNEHTLIPRPETELLVELTLAQKGHFDALSVLDLGTGSGAIALALAAEKPQWQISAIDCNAKALMLAMSNAANLGLNNIHFLQSDWFTELAPTQQFDVILSNPPYLANQDPHLKQGDLRFEPLHALVSGEDGLTAIKHIIKHSLARLKPNGLLLLEHAFDQNLTIRSMLNKYGYKASACWQDYQGHDRISGGYGT